MEVVIAGGHGAIARRLSRLLAERGDGVKAMIRNPDHAGDVREDGADPLIMDIETSASEQIAMEIADADAVVFAAGAGPGSGAERKLTVDRDGAIKLLYAAKRASIRRFVIVSSVGAEDPPDDDEVFSVYLRAKAAADEAVRATGLDWIILRPGQLTDDAGTGQVELTTEPHRAPITRDDVAGTLAAILANDKLARQVLYVSNGDVPIDKAVAAA